MYIKYRQVIEISPPKFTEEYLKFFGALFSVFLAFYLVNIFWAKEKGSKQSNQLHRLCLIHLESLIMTGTKIKEIHNRLLEKDWHENEWKDMYVIDTAVLKDIEKLKSIYNEFLKIVNDNGDNLTYDKQLESVILTLMQEAGPIIQNLSLLKSTIPNKKIISFEFDKVIQIASQAKGQLLKEQV
jgi:hypothetical protein